MPNTRFFAFDLLATLVAVVRFAAASPLGAVLRWARASPNCLSGFSLGERVFVRSRMRMRVCPSVHVWCARACVLSAL